MYVIPILQKNFFFIYPPLHSSQIFVKLFLHSLSIFPACFQHFLIFILKKQKPSNCGHRGPEFSRLLLFENCRVQPIQFWDKENALSVSVSVLVSADTVFYIGSFTDTVQPYFTWCKCYICSKDFNINTYQQGT